MNPRMVIDGDAEAGADSLERDPAPLPPEFPGNQSFLHRSNEDLDSYIPPTSEEWKTMKGYGSFITHDEENVEYVFHVHDIIYVLPAGMNPDGEPDISDLWLAEIRSIRAHNSDNVWIKVKWFYHPSELPKNVKGATGKLHRFGKYERISSNQADFIPTSTCCGVATIKSFDEQDMEQEEIQDGVFFYRYDYDWQACMLKGPSPPCSICKKAFSPNIDIMHFCPRLGCCRSWHNTCLAAANWYITSPVDLPQRLESLGRDWTPFAMDCDDGGPQKKKARASSSLSPPLPADPYGNIPLPLLNIARQPVVRGGAMGIVGNVRSVVRARKLLQEAIQGFAEIPTDWMEKLGKTYDSGMIPPPKEIDKSKGKGKGGRVRPLAYQCPRCGEPI